VTAAAVLGNARLAGSEIRTQIDHQITAGRDTDTKLIGLITAISLAAGLVTARLHLDGPETFFAAAFTGAVALFAVGMAFQGLRAGADTSFGVDPEALASVLEEYDDVAIALALTEGLVRSRERNLKGLNAKWRYLDLSLLGVFLTLLSIGLLVNTGAVQ
jgi:hypothetical protein